MSELYKLPDGWEWYKFSDIVENHDKDRLPIKATDRESMQGKFPYYGSTGIIDYVNQFIYDGEYLLISEDGANLTVRKYPIAFIAYGKFWVNNHSHVVKAKNTITTNKFIEMYFATLSLDQYITGSAQPKLSQKKLNTIPIPLPPLPEQQRIVSKLDLLFEKIDKSIALHQKNIDEANVFMGSVLNDVFGELEEIYQVVAVGTITDCIVPQRNKPKQFIGDIKWITTNDLILFNRVSKSSKGLGLRREEIAESQSKVIPKESVLMSCVGYLGMVSIADVEMVVNQQLHTFQCNEAINNKFLMYALYVKQNYMYHIANITTVAYMNKSKCNSIPIPLAPLLIQEKVVKYLDEISKKIEKIKSVQKEKTDSLKALKASILDSAFRGEL